MVVPIRVAVSGALGSMGRETCAAVLGDPELELVAAVDPAYAGTDETFPAGRPTFLDLETALGSTVVDVVVDFTEPGAVLANVRTALEHRVAAVVGTTGIGPEDVEGLQALAEETSTPAFIAPNFALGAVLMMEFARQAARLLDACEIVELHHERKLDAPSGTAKRTAALIEEEWAGRAYSARPVPIHSVRLPGLVAHQEVIFGGLGETLTLRHDSLSRQSFMPGVLLAIKRVRSLQGAVVGLENIV